LDDPVQKYWPGFSIKTNPPNARGVTFRQLATQLSGLPSADPCLYFPACNITTFQAFQRISEEFISVHPSDYLPHYSDLAFSVLGRALEKPAAMSWEDHLTERILQPLGLQSTGWEYTPEIIAQMPIPSLGLFKLPNEVAFIDMDWSRPTGGMHSSVNDLIKFVHMFLNSTHDTSIVQSASLREMLLPSYINDDRYSGFGFPFEIFYLESSRTWAYTKGGFFPGFTAEMAMIPKLNYGHVVLNNNIYAILVSDLINDIFVPALEAYLKGQQVLPPNPGNLTLFEGVYQASNAPFPFPVNYTVTVWEEKNLLNMTTQTTSSPRGSTGPTLQWYSGNMFKILSPPGQCFSMESDSGGEFVTFDFDQGKNQVTSFTYLETDPLYSIILSRIA